MKILVISDTHGNVQRAMTALANAEPVDMVIHLGDGYADADMLRDAQAVPVINVAGNCDYGSYAPREQVWNCEGKRLLLTHGDAYQVKSGLFRLLQRGQEAGVDAVLFGHTHLALLEHHSDILLLNPGSLANHCHHRSYAIVTITVEGITARHLTID